MNTVNCTFCTLCADGFVTKVLIFLSHAALDTSVLYISMNNDGVHT